MPTKKPAAKPSTKAPAKKTSSAKAAPAKKPVAKSASAKPVAKAATKAVSKAPVKAVVKPAAKPVKATKAAVAKPTPVKAVATKPATKEIAKVIEVKADKAPAKVAATAVTAAPKTPEVKMPSQPKVVAIAERTKRPATPVAADGEEGDGSESSTNLLAGPRNVTPYQPKRGEQYMNKEQLEHFRQILSTWKRDLMEEVDRTVHHMKDEAANFPDPNDRATQESEFSLELRTRDRERKLIRKIEEAIARIDDGSYGYCVETGEEIGIKRLEARPVATLSVEAQERRERREKQYGDRDDRYR
jgi:DnaK suppressor protein